MSDFSRDHHRPEAPLLSAGPSGVAEEGDELVPAVAADAQRVFGERLTVGDLFTSYAKSFSTRVVPDCWWSGIWKAIAGTSAFSGTALRARRYSALQPAGQAEGWTRRNRRVPDDVLSSEYV
jgi:hypothetical protein